MILTLSEKENLAIVLPMKYGDIIIQVHTHLGPEDGDKIRQLFYAVVRDYPKAFPFKKEAADAVFTEMIEGDDPDCGLYFTSWQPASRKKTLATEATDKDAWWSNY